MPRSNRTITVLAVALVAFASVLLAACGSSSNDPSDSSAGGNTVDAMFVNGMIPHHQAAIDMAELARTKAKHEEVKQLANNIIESQSAEIKQMKGMQQDLPSTGRMMMSQSQMRSMMGDVDELRSAKNFDEAFLLAMIPHHQMAVVMSRQAQRNGTSAEVDKLAAGIITAQQKEIAEMRSWLKDWYGVTAPTGSTGGMMGPGSMGSMDHGSMH